MKILLLISCAIVYLSGYAQKAFVPVGAEWNYAIGYDSYPSSIQGHFALKSLQDTIIDADTFSNINNEYFITSSDSFDYYFFKTGTPKKRLFKTNSQIGDTVTVDVYFKSITTHSVDTFVPLQIVIDNIHPMENNILNTNDSTKVFEFSIIEDERNNLPYSLPSNHGTYIDHIGQPGGFRSFIQFFSPPSAAGVTTHLRCFSSSEYNYKPVGLMHSCNYSKVGINNVNTNTNLNVTVYPNPAHIDLNFYFKTGIIHHITVYNLKGEPVAEYRTNGKSHHSIIDISGLRPDLYQCIIETNAGKTALPISIE